MSGIKGAVCDGEYKCFGINNWNALILHIFGEIKLAKYKYKGKNGLENVVKTLKKFENNNNKIPRTTDKEMRGIKRTPYRGCGLILE